MPFSSLNYTRCVVIVHGKSEYHIVRYIYTNLHLPLKIYARDKGRHSIQINSLNTLLKKKPFHSLKAFAQEYAIEYEKKTKELKNFKLFIIMDTDDCDEKTKQDYISGRLFQGTPLSNYIVPIFNTNSLEDAMLKAGIMTKRIASAEKGEYYSKIFPINTAPHSINTINEVRMFADEIKKVRETNLVEFVEYCISMVSEEYR